MDVLEYWRPTIDWSLFNQGPVSDRMWRLFQELVQLCHAYKFWKATAAKMPRRPAPSLYAESNYMRRKRRQEVEGEVRQTEEHMYRAAYLASDKMASMSFLISRDDKDSPDWVLWVSLWLALEYQPNHERARCEAAAFDAFDAESILQQSPESLAKVWLGQAGLTNAAVLTPNPYD